MEPQISSSELTVHSDNYAEKAWHLVSIILSIRRPVSVRDLAGKCSLFCASPEFVEFLCSIPNSPIFLSENKFVLLSMVAFNAFGEIFANSMPRFEIEGPKVGMLCGNVVRTYFRKRKKLGNEVMQPVKKRAVLKCVSGNEQESYSTQRIFDSCFKVADLQTARSGILCNELPNRMSIKAAIWEYFSNVIYATPSIVNTDVGLLGYNSQNDEDQGNGLMETTFVGSSMHKGGIMDVDKLADNCYNDDVTTSGNLDRDLIESLARISAMLDEDDFEDRNLVDILDVGTFLSQPDQPEENALVEAETSVKASEDFRNNRVPETRLEEFAEQPLMDYEIPQERVGNFSFGSFGRDLSPGDKLCQTKMQRSDCQMLALKESLQIKERDEFLVYADPKSIDRKCTQVSPATKNAPQADMTRKQQVASKSIQPSKVDIVTQNRRSQKDQSTIAMKHKSCARIEERRDNVHKPAKDQQDSKSFPEFESYIVEEEEGSGGYGVVYRARRKTDGTTFAIKCPHVNAHKSHVKNELKMLERFGGRNFVIKYEGSFKNDGGSDCFVLEHFEHDRPEVLKREIKISQLQWYGYCMFRALASLHKQGVIHRDVKPGNFLFSCKSNKGYLIDFNLAKDLHQNHEIIGLQSKSVSPNKRRKILGGKSMDTSKAIVPSGSNLESKTLKKKTVDKVKAYNGSGLRNSITSQGADASGLTSAKDVTPSGERLKEPLHIPQNMPRARRAQLINLAQEAMQSPSLGPPSTPASNRKRVAASPGITDKKLIYLTPMPLHSSGVAISGAGLLKNRGEVKSNKEGQCVGTKGFRAPEVLLRSLHQGPKLDVWSAGVTLLYIITGKLPFMGDPEQNMKDIVKIRGNEDLWEVAKLHNRESSFPVDLLDVRYLPSMKIKEWCRANTKRPDFLEVIPGSLFDLIEKCLTVNPRLRISSEEAFRHEFFDTCHEALRKQRSMRRAPNHDSMSNSLFLLRETSSVKPGRAATPVKNTKIQV